MTIKTDQLANCRKKIDLIDIKILELLSKRFSLCKKLVLLKQRLDLTILDKKREETCLKLRKKEAKKFEISEKFSLSLFKVIFRESRLIQKEINASTSFDKNTKK